MPVFFDVYEYKYGIESFGVRLSILVRISDFMIVLNSATNSLAYFGKKRFGGLATGRTGRFRWLEKRLRLHILKKEERRQQKATGRRNNSVSGPSSQCSPAQQCPTSYVNSAEVSQLQLPADEAVNCV